MEKVEIIPVSCPLDVGTRIHWDAHTHSAYSVDVPNSDVYKHNIHTGLTTKAKVGKEPLAFMFPVEGSDHRFIAGLGRKIVFVDWDGQSDHVSKVETIVEVDTEKGFEGNRLNGAKVDPEGRLWAGTMGPNDCSGNIIHGKGSLYSLEKGVLKKHESNITCSNGLAWNVKEKKMYYIDTFNPAVFQYDFSATGHISNKTKVFDFKQQNVEGLPDGLTIDSEHQLWVCTIYGSHLIRFNPNNGHISDKIKLPTSQVTSVSFGGKKLDKMFVTTARIPVDGKVPASPAGTTYIIDHIGITGYAGDRYKEK